MKATIQMLYINYSRYLRLGLLKASAALIHPTLLQLHIDLSNMATVHRLPDSPNL